MKILVCISIVPDTTSKITKEESDNFLKKSDLTFIVGPYDDYALSRAIEIKESSENVEVAVLHVGLESTEPLIRKCLALGADYAIRINGDPKSSIQIANEICHYVKENNFDLILMGKEAIDYNSGMIHGLVASGLNFNHFSPVMKLEVKDQGDDPAWLRVTTSENSKWIITVNRQHPFMESFTVADPDSLEPVLRLALAIGIAEIQGMSSGFESAGFLRIQINELLRNYLSNRSDVDVVLEEGEHD